MDNSVEVRRAAPGFGVADGLAGAMRLEQRRGSVSRHPQRSGDGNRDGLVRALGLACVLRLARHLGPVSVDQRHGVDKGLGLCKGTSRVEGGSNRDAKWTAARTALAWAEGKGRCDMGRAKADEGKIFQMVAVWRERWVDEERTRPPRYSTGKLSGAGLEPDVGPVSERMGPGLTKEAAILRRDGGR